MDMIKRHMYAAHGIKRCLSTTPAVLDISFLLLSSRMSLVVDLSISLYGSDEATKVSHTSRQNWRCTEESRVVSPAVWEPRCSEADDTVSARWLIGRDSFQSARYYCFPHLLRWRTENSEARTAIKRYRGVLTTDAAFSRFLPRDAHTKLGMSQ